MGPVPGVGDAANPACDLLLNDGRAGEGRYDVRAGWLPSGSMIACDVTVLESALVPRLPR